MELREYHPLSEQYSMMPEDDLQNLIDDMRKRGFDASFPIILYQGKILDGRNRYMASVCCKVQAIYENFEGTEEEAAIKVRAANEHRRHLTAAWFSKRRDERLKRIEIARAEGKSLRAIAAEEKISEMRVRDDIKEIQVRRGFAPEEVSEKSDDLELTPATIIGRDGKEYSADKTPTDLAGHPLTDATKEAFGVLVLYKQADQHAAALAKVIAQIANHCGGIELSKNLVDMKSGHLSNLVKDLKATRPHSICPNCEGSANPDCNGCRGSGWWTESAWKKADVKTRVLLQ